MSVIFISDEANLIQSVITPYSQIEGHANADTDRIIARSILLKVREQILSHFLLPINFTEQEIILLQQILTRYITTHGKPAGDIEATYWVRFDMTTRQLLANILNKVGENLGPIQS